MSHAERVFRELAARQHGVAAVWQLRLRGVARTSIDHWIRTRRPQRIHRGVYGDASGRGRIMAAALALGPGAAVSHASALAVWGMRPEPDGNVQVSTPGLGGRRSRDGILVHRRGTLERTTWAGIPVTPPARTLLDARLPRHESYRALEASDAFRLPMEHDELTTPTLREVMAVLRLGMNPTRSDAEARFLFLCRDHRIAMPVVNHRLNGFEADFHWPQARLVVEVDGFEFHRERSQFEQDRERGLTHRIAGYEVIRASALQVAHRPASVAAAVLAAAPSLGVPR